MNSGNTVINTGTISSTNQDGVEAASNNTIRNDGTISSAANDAIDVSNNNTITNTGTITGGSGGGDRGIEANSDNTITNSGTITSTGDSGIFVTDRNTITSTGTVSGGNGSGDFGIRGRNENVVTNSGTVTSGGDIGITVTNRNTVVNSGFVKGGTNNQGISVNNDNNVTNTGTIISQNNDGISGNTRNTITNSGRIQGGSTGNAKGIDINGSATIINSGQIFGNDGIEIRSGAIVNSGLIQGNLGIDNRGGSDDLAVTNSGTIIGTGGQAIDFRGGDDTLSLQPGSNIHGTISFGGGTDTLNVAPGLSIVNTFAGTAPEVVNANGAPVVVNGLQVAVVDPTGFSLQDDVIIDLTNGVSYAVFGALDAARTGNGGASTRRTQPQYLSYSQSSPEAHPDTGWRFWSRTYGTRRKQEGSGASVDGDHSIIGSVYGADTTLWNKNTRGGGFVGASISVAEAAFKSQKTQIDSFYGGLYIGSSYGNFALDFAIYGGHTSHDRSRQVANNLAGGGLQIAQADFDGTFIAPEASLTANLPHGFVARGRARYISFHIDGFSETGAAGNFTAGDRNLEIFHGRFQLGRPFVTSGEGSSYTRIEPYIGVQGRSLLSGENINATLLGQSLTFSPGGEESEVSVFIGAGLSARMTDSLDFYANAEANIEEFQSDYHLNASFGFKYKF